MLLRLFDVRKIVLLIQCYFIIFVLFLQPLSTHAQQTIFNVPSADVTERGMIFFQHQSSFSNEFANFDNNFVYGLGKNTEFDLTLFGVGTKSIRNEILAPGFKTVIPIFEKSKTKITFGHLIPISLIGKGIGGYTYSHVSTIVPKTKTRITSGIAIGTEVLFGRDFVSYVGALEQPITRKLSLAVEWYSGKHANGFLIPGFYYHVSPKFILSAAYKIRNNHGNGHNGFIIELSKFF